MLTRVAKDAQRALLAVEQADGLLEDEPVRAAYELLADLIGQDFDVDQDGVPRLHRGTRSGRIISTIDDIYERELIDLFGAHIDGLPTGRALPAAGGLAGRRASSPEGLEAEDHGGAGADHGGAGADSGAAAPTAETEQKGAATNE